MLITSSGIANGGSRGLECPTWQQKNDKNLEKKGKIGKEGEKIRKKLGKKEDKSGGKK